MQMGKMLKNLLIVLALVCMIVLVVFCVELFMLNRGGNSGGDDAISSPAGNSAGGGEGEGQAAPGTNPPSGEGASDDAGRAGGESPSPGRQTEAPSGTRYEHLMPPGDSLLILYADDETFEYIELNDGYLYEYTGGGTASLEVSMVHMPLGIDARAGDYLDGYVGSGGTITGRETPIGRSSLEGVYVHGEIDGEKYEAWIHSFAEVGIEDMGVAFIIHYRNDGQKNALNNILDTLTLVDGPG